MSKDLFTHLILKSFQGNLTAEEQTLLDNWLAEDDSHRSLHQKLIESWKQAEDYKSAFSVDLDKGWKSIQSRIENGGTVRSIVPLWKQPAIQIAASLLLLIGLTWAGYSFFGTGNSAGQFITHVTGVDEVSELVLPDGSTVWLNEESQLKYSSDFEIRNIQLQGEAQFQVEHDAEHPFVVSAGGTTTRVLGTKFNIASYAQDNQVRVSLIEGKVSFALLSDIPESDELILVPGETALFNRQSNTLSKQETSSPNFNSWQTGQLIFEQESVEYVLADVGDYFDMDIKLEILNQQDCLFTGTFSQPSFDEIMNVLSFTFDLNHSERDGNHYVTIQNCQ